MAVLPASGGCGAPGQDNFLLSFFYLYRLICMTMDSSKLRGCAKNINRFTRLIRSVENLFDRNRVQLCRITEKRFPLVQAEKINWIYCNIAGKWRIKSVLYFDKPDEIILNSGATWHSTIGHSKCPWYCLFGVVAHSGSKWLKSTKNLFTRCDCTKIFKHLSAVIQHFRFRKSKKMSKHCWH